MKKKLEPNNFIRIPGIYGKEIDMNQYDEISFFAKYFAPKSAIGCSVSHRKAIKTFYNTSKKEYALILEDDAIPINSSYMEETELAIKNAPSDWDMIKLDYWPNNNIGTFTKSQSLLATACIVNRNWVKKIMNLKTHYHQDVEWNFYNVKIYNNPTIVFQQVWDEKNNSNNRTIASYNPISYFYEGLNFKIVRIFHYEFTLADLILFIIMLVIFVLIILKFTTSMKFIHPKPKRIF
jgi:hypothetical protein